MSAIALVLADMGHHVSGSDAKDSPSLRALVQRGLAVKVGHDPALVAQADLVARSSAVRDDNPEVLAARAAGLEVWSRAQLLRAVCDTKEVVAVAGTHGKTTTSALLVAILESAGRRPSMVVGAELRGRGPGGRFDPAGKLMVVEADESDGTFLELGASLALVTNVEVDHLDFYGDEASMREAYERFVLEATGPIVVCADDPGSASLAGSALKARRDVVTYGTCEGSDLRATQIEVGRERSVFWLEGPLGGHLRVELGLPGHHNVLNATGALAAAAALGVAPEEAVGALGSFLGVSRRFEKRGERLGVSFVDDYGHLPSEVAATVKTALAGGWERVVVVFQPHRYSRTALLWREFAPCFDGVDLLVLTEIYPAGEQPRPGVSGRLIYEQVRSRSRAGRVLFASDLTEAAALLRSSLRPGDLCLTVGAGDVTNVASMLLAGDGW